MEAWPGPLSGLHVLDLSRLLPGGYATLLLADLGADVVKVEEPGRGDYVRSTPPLVEGESAAHVALNRGKRSIALDLRSPEGPPVLRRLTKDADVLVESFRPGVLDRLDAGWPQLHAANPRLVWCAITGYGQDGPYRDRVGHDLTYAGYGGLVSMNGPAGGPPVPLAAQMGDLGGGMLAVVGILAALRERDRTGEGTFVDASMLDAVVSSLSVHAAVALADGHAPGPGEGMLAGGLACYRVYPTADGRAVTVAALEPRFWRALCGALELPELVADQFAAPPRQEEMAGALGARFATRPRAEWLELLAGLEVCVGPVNDVLEALGDPQVRHREMVAEVDGRRVGPAGPLRFDGVAPTADRRAPGLGEHTDEVLEEAGFTRDEMAGLRDRGVV